MWEERLVNKNDSNLNSVSVASVSHVSPTLVRPVAINLLIKKQRDLLHNPSAVNRSVNRQRDSLVEPAVSNRTVSKQLGSLYKPAVFNQSVIRQQGLTFKSAASILTGNKQRGFSSVSVVPTHSRNKPSAVITHGVNSTAHTSASWSVNTPQGPVYEPSPKQRQDESRCVMQRVETPSQPLGLLHKQRRQGLWHGLSP